MITWLQLEHLLEFLIALSPLITLSVLLTLDCEQCRTEVFETRWALCKLIQNSRYLLMKDINQVL